MQITENPSFLQLLLKAFNNCLRHFKLCALIVLIPTITVFILVMWVIKPTYRAEAIVTPPSGKAAIGGAIGKLLESSSEFSSISSLFGGSEQATNIVWTFLMSWELHERILEKFNLAEHYEFKGKYKADLLKEFRKNLEIDYNDEAMLAISLEDKDVHLAVQIVRYILTETDSMYNAYKTKQARESRLYMDARLKEVEHLIDSLQQEFATFQSKNDFYNPEIQLESTVKYLTSLQTERDAVKLELTSEKMNYSENTKRYEELSNRLKAIDEAIAQTRQGKKSNVGVVSLKKSPELATQYLRLENELKIQLGVYKLLRQQSEQLRLEEANMMTNLVILQPPWENDKKVAPKRMTLLAFTMLISGLFCLCICNFLEFYKTLPVDSSLKKEVSFIFSFLRRKGD